MDHFPTYVEKHRLAGMQDAVYGIAVTLLVLELKLPNLGEGATNATVLNALVDLVPKMLTWFLSFWVVCIFWASDTRILRHVKSVDRRLYLACLVQLALASLLPFSTALLGEHGDLMVPCALYSLHISAMGLVSAFRLWHMRRHPALLAEEASAFSVDDLLRSNLIALVASLLAFGLAFVTPGHNMYALLLIPASGMLKRFKK